MLLSVNWASLLFNLAKILFNLTLDNIGINVNDIALKNIMLYLKTSVQCVFICSL